MVHLRGLYPNMAEYIKDHGCISWYERTYNLDKLGNRKDGKAEELGEEEVENVEVETAASSFTCLKPLVQFAEKMMRGTYEVALCKLTGDSIAGKSLNLAAQEDTLSKILADVGVKYAADFPPKRENEGESHINLDGMEVIKSSVVADKGEYEIELDKYLKAARENETQQIKEYIMSRIAFVVDDLTDDLPNKISRQGLAKESKRKMCIYSSELLKFDIVM